MGTRAASRKGGQSKSPAKVLAVRKNGNKGGRPTRREVLMRELDRLLPILIKALPDRDPGDLMLILERMLRKPGSNRRFFIYPNKSGGYAF
jgi:hypothetical protein